MKRAYLSAQAYPEIKIWLREKGYLLTELQKSEKPYPSISDHPDIYMCKIGDRLIIAKPDEIGEIYPDYLGCNGIFLDGYYIHNLKYTSPVLLREAERLGLKLVHVNQGYTKCSCVVVDGRSVITADEGIYNALSGIGDIDVLKITPGHVELEGFEYGFLGGATGRVDSTVLFNGDLDLHPDGDLIRGFIEDRGVGIFDVKGLPLRDIGTIYVGTVFGESHE